ncbi:MAG: serine hydroxymethyltransferase, partial [Candidatus Zixiibacteriota bacterium]
MRFLPKDDPELAELIRNETSRIEETLDLIAAENHAPRSVMEALGSILNTKTIEGYPGKRFHAGCVYADEVENLAISRGKHLFGAKHVNVQPHSGTSANLAVYFSVLDVGDRILAMSLPHGGHLSHGHAASITSRCFEFEHYNVDSGTELIDYNQVMDLALKFRPKMMVAGASSYARLIDYEKMAAIASEVSAYLLVDMAHIAGLVAAKVIPSPVPHSDFVTFTCYKTMMGGRGGVILSKQKYGDQIDRAIFPGCQGTSPVNVIA